MIPFGAEVVGEVNPSDVVVHIEFKNVNFFREVTVAGVNTAYDLAIGDGTPMEG